MTSPRVVFSLPPTDQADKSYCIQAFDSQDDTAISEAEAVGSCSQDEVRELVMLQDPDFPTIQQPPRPTATPCFGGRLASGWAASPFDAALGFHDALAILVAEHDRVVAHTEKLLAENSSLRELLHMPQVQQPMMFSPRQSRSCSTAGWRASTCDVEDDEGVRNSSKPSLLTAPAGMSKTYSEGRVLRNLNGDKRYEHIRCRVGEGVTGTDSTLTTMWDYAMAEGWIKWQARERAESRSRLYHLVHSDRFNFICSVMIVVNCVCIAASTDYGARNNVHASDMPLFYALLDYIFSAWFLIELLLRIASAGPCDFWSLFTPQTPWNYFDTIVVCANVVEVGSSFLEDEAEKTGAMNITATRMLRVLRMARAFRIIRFLRFFKELRMMILSILRGGRTLLWAIVLLSLFVFVFSIYLTQNVTAFRLQSPMPQSEEERELLTKLEKMFGSLIQSAYTLFQSVTGGISWIEVSDPLIAIHWFNGLLFCFYIFFTIVAMLNIITGIFVDTALKVSVSDKDDCIQQQLQQEDSTLRQMQKIFDEADTERTGCLTFTQFDRTIGQPHMRLHLAALGIDVGEAEAIFRLLDMDNSGTISTAEFLFGCMRMKGQAKSLDLVTLMYENKRMIEKWRRFENYIQQEFEDVKSMHASIVKALKQGGRRSSGMRRQPVP